MAFVAFVTSCLPNSCKYVWIVRNRCDGGRKMGRLAYAYVINIHELQASRSASSFLPFVFLPFVSSRGFLPFRRSFSRRRNFIASARLLAYWKPAMRLPWIQIALEKSKLYLGTIDALLERGDSSAVAWMKTILLRPTRSSWGFLFCFCRVTWLNRISLKLVLHAKCGKRCSANLQRKIR